MFFAIWLLIGLVIVIGVVTHVNAWESHNPNPTKFQQMMHEMDVELFHSHLFQAIIVLLGPIPIFVIILNTLTKNKGGGDFDI